jgi:hypothetical protein
MNFPNIDYEFWFSYWGDSIGKMPVYSNKNMKPYIEFKNDINSCTQEIYELTKKDKNLETL